MYNRLRYGEKMHEAELGSSSSFFWILKFSFLNWHFLHICVLVSSEMEGFYVDASWIFQKRWLNIELQNILDTQSNYLIIWSAKHQSPKKVRTVLKAFSCTGLSSLPWHKIPKLCLYVACLRHFLTHFLYPSILSTMFCLLAFLDDFRGVNLSFR